MKAKLCRHSDDYQRAAAVVAKILPFLEWRWHGIGLLQAYIHESEFGKEYRVHIWSRKLLLPNIDQTGNIHDHRFDLHSTVLLGRIRHTEYELVESDGSDLRNQLYELYVLRQNARRQLGTSKPQEDEDMIRQAGLYDPTIEEVTYFGGNTYTFPRGQFHKTEPVTEIACTLVTKENQVDTMARILGPLDMPPVPAFSRHISEIPELATSIINQTQKAMFDLLT